MSRETDKAKETWWTEKCQAIESLDRLHQQVKELSGEKKGGKRQIRIAKRNGDIVTEPRKVKEM